jgi:hypothetical protein
MYFRSGIGLTLRIDRNDRIFAIGKKGNFFEEKPFIFPPPRQRSERVVYLQTQDACSEVQNRDEGDGQAERTEWPVPQAGPGHPDEWDEMERK